MLTKVLFLIAFRFVFEILQTEARYLTISRKIDEPHRRVTRFIPGSKLCEKEYAARNKNNVGYFNETDKCCKEYDNCDKFIPPHGTAYGLVNDDSSAINHCDCDKKFYECLKNTSSNVSRTTKRIRSIILNGRCFREKPCPSGKTCETTEYEIVNEGEWRTLNKIKSECYDMSASAEISCFSGILRYIKFKFGISVSEYSESL